MRQYWRKRAEKRVYNSGVGEGFCCLLKDTKSRCSDAKILIVYYVSILNPGECIVTNSTGRCRNIQLRDCYTSDLDPDQSESDKTVIRKTTQSCI